MKLARDLETGEFKAIVGCDGMMDDGDDHDEDEVEQEAFPCSSSLRSSWISFFVFSFFIIIIQFSLSPPFDHCTGGKACCFCIYCFFYFCVLAFPSVCMFFSLFVHAAVVISEIFELAWL